MKHGVPLALHIPDARFRPGDTPDFSYLQLSKGGTRIDQRSILKHQRLATSPLGWSV